MHRNQTAPSSRRRHQRKRSVRFARSSYGRRLRAEQLEARQMLTTNGFTGDYVLDNWTSTGIFEGTTSITPNTGSATEATFDYNVDLGTSGPGVSQRTADFLVPSTVTGSVSFDYEYTGNHAYSGPRAEFSAVVGSNATEVLNQSTFANFSYTGSTTLIARQGESFGFRIGGENNDSTSILRGDLTITNLVVNDSIVVDTITDVDDGDISPGNLSLREAIGLANSIPGADRITFAESFNTNQNVQLAGQLPTITDSLTIDGPGSDLLTLTAGSGFRHLLVDSPSATAADVTISGMTLTGGDVGSDDGGAILNHERLVLRGMNITQNSADLGGGGIHNTGDLTVVDSSISGNVAATSGGRGGGIRNFGGMLDVTNSTINDNVARFGGGIEGSAIVNNSTLSGNESNSGGDAIYLSSGSMVLDNASVTRSYSGSKAAILLDGGQLTMTNSTLSQNYSGEGLRVDSGSANLRHVTITGNTASNGAGRGIRMLGGSVSIANSLVVGNEDAEIEVSGGTLNSGGHNLFGHAGQTTAQALLNVTPNGTDLTGTSDGTNPTALSGILDTTLADNGGPTQTHALPSTSPAINGGDPNVLPGVGAPPFDQRGEGFVRVLGGRIDIGAIEQQETPSLIVTTPADTDDLGDFQTSLREAIAFANASADVDTVTFDASVFDGELADLVRLTQGTIVVTEPVILDGGGTVVISGDAGGDDTIDAGGVTTSINGSDNSRVLDFTHATGSSTLQGVMVTGGLATDDGPPEDQNGGGIRAAADLQIANSRISGNRTLRSGGGVFAAGTLTVTDSTIDNNYAFNGGGAFATSAVIERSTLRSNYGAITGGGVEATNLSLQSSTVSGNTARDVGGVSALNATITSSTISGNYGNYYVGGVSANAAVITYSTIVGNGTGGNYGDDAGGVRVFGSLTLSNSIVAGNTTTNGASPDLRVPGSTSLRASLIGDNTGTSLSESQAPDINFNLIGSAAGAGAINPLLGGLTDNGGPTQTRALLPGSPALNAGEPAFGGSPSFDQRGTGFDRLRGGRIDMGAFEQQTEFPSLVVTTISDVVDAADFVTSLREAINFANGQAGADTITFAAALDGQTINLSGTQLTVTAATTIDANALAAGVTIEAGFQSRVLQNSSSETLTLRNLTLTGGSTSGDGGGIHSRDGDLILQNTTVTRNTANGIGSQGGGIYSLNGNVTVTNSTVTSNVSGGQGGGIFAFRGDLTISNSTVSNNSASSEGGGTFTFEGPVVIASSTVSGNMSGSDGGGIFTDSGSVTLTSSTVSGNNSDSDGGGIYADSGSVSLTTSTVSGNSSVAEGGGIYVDTGFLMLNNSTVSGNSSAGLGGGIYTDDAIVLIEHSTITGNTAEGTGGGVALLADNYADERLTVRNSIIAGNTDNGTAPDLQAVGDPANDQLVEFSLIGNTTGAGLNLGTSNNNLTDVDPLLGPLADNGGPTQTHALRVGSPAIDAGDPSAVAGQNGVPQFDQRGAGFNRVQGNRIDIGAFETTPTSADFDADGDVDGADFLSWQRGFGIQSPNATPADGDADLDNDVDSDDLAIWQNRYGQATGTSIAARSSHSAKGSRQGVAESVPVSALSAELIDAAMALALVDEEVDLPRVDESEPSLSPVHVSNDDHAPVRTGVSQKFETDKSKSDHETDNFEETFWLTDEMLESVFS